MIKDIQGLHHVTSLASDAIQNNLFFTETLGMRRVKRTVNFDAPDVYHLYYGDRTGTPGTVMTYFPFPGMAAGRAGAGEVGTTAFAIPKGAGAYWLKRLTDRGVEAVSQDSAFGEPRILFAGPDGDRFALVETDALVGDGWTDGGVDDAQAIHGFHSVRLRLAEADATAELLTFMGYEQVDQSDGITRFAVTGNATNPANTIEIEARSSLTSASQGAGSVHHVAFAVADVDTERRVRSQLVDTGYQVTPVIDRDYFKSIYFRTPGGVLFEIATNEPGFDRDEPVAELGAGLKLPGQHEHLRDKLENALPALA
ncbi:MAG: ring-cleaving dioxygenase [Pseudomonadota bacterium]